jgi:hypothetical protein
MANLTFYDNKSELSYMYKNVFCKNTKLSEDEFLEILYSYFLLESATACGLKIGRSRQSVLTLFGKIGNRIGNLLKMNDFPNFSTDLANQIFADEPDVRRLLDEFIHPQKLKLILARRFETKRPTKYIELKNAVVVKRLLNNDFFVSVYDGTGNAVLNGHAGADDMDFFRNLFRKKQYKNFNEVCDLAEKILGIMNISVPDSGGVSAYIPEVEFEDYLEYKEDNVVLYEESSLLEHGIYRMLNLMRQTEKNLRGFSEVQFEYYINRIRLIELMFRMHQNNKLSFNERIVLAKKSAYCFMMFSLRLKPL